MPMPMPGPGVPAGAEIRRGSREAGGVQSGRVQIVEIFVRVQRGAGADQRWVSFGVGGALGTWISGMIWGDGSQTMWVWVFAASCAFLSMIAVMLIPNINGETTANAVQE